MHAHILGGFSVCWPPARALAPVSAPAAAGCEVDSSTFGGLEARAIGPAVMSGRIAAIDAVAGDPLTLYVGAASGGVWKSKDGGTTFKPVFDEHTQSIGAVASIPANPKTVWVGTGESWTRNSVSVGDGVYKTTDGGDNWSDWGSRTPSASPRIRVSPANGNTVCVCATGHLWNANEERGVYKTTDGGKTWKRVLYVDADTGCADLAIDPQEPRILYAGMWQFRRAPHFFSSGGPGSGALQEHRRRRDLAASSRPACRPATRGASPSPWRRRGRASSTPWSRPRTPPSTAPTTLGETLAGDELLLQHPGASVLLRPPRRRSRPTTTRVYKPGLSLTVSDDGGKTFNGLVGPGGGGLHSDHHALWINPKDPSELMLGTDGGVYISSDQGAALAASSSALPVSQFYHVSYDMDAAVQRLRRPAGQRLLVGPSRGASAASRTATGATSAPATASTPSAIPATPTCVYVEYQGGEISRLRLLDRREQGRSSRCPAAASRSTASTGTRRST